MNAAESTFGKTNSSGGKEKIEQTTAQETCLPDGYELDDLTYIQEMKHVPAGVWHQYDVLLAARGYGWETMVSWAAYMSKADLNCVSELMTGGMYGMEIPLIDQYRENGGKIESIPQLQAEKSFLSIAGASSAVRAPMKIVWFNQTRVLRFFTVIDDESVMRRYIETVIRRTFGTENAMKLAKPLPEHT